MNPPKLLDLFCCAGGAAAGYFRAGFAVYGVDIEPQPHYPFAFHKGDALEVLRDLLAGRLVRFSGARPTTLSLDDFAAVHASPPCQGYSTITPDQSRHARLIEPVRTLLKATGLPYVIENVEGARRHMDNPLRLCGSSFGLGVRRHRYFESNALLTPVACNHAAQPRPVGVYGSHPEAPGKTYRRPNGGRRGDRAHSAVEAGAAMGGVHWMNWRELAESIPPAYTEHLGRQLLEAL